MSNKKELIEGTIGSLVVICWADAIENLEGWHSEEEAIDWADSDDWVVHQAGWILKETEEYILISAKQNIASNGRESAFGQIMKIPKPWIIYRKEIVV